MLQSWTNFMSPSGGSMENSLEFGMSSLFVDIAASLSVKHIFEPLRKSDLANARSGIMNRARSIKSKGIQIRSPYDYAASIDDIKSPHLNPNIRSRYNSIRSGINSKYSRLKSGAKAIGWGYLMLGAAQVAESITTPGLTMAAQANNAATMGMQGPLDSSQAYTQRQRALMAIHDSQLGIRNVIGNEARHLHR